MLDSTADEDQTCYKLIDRSSENWPGPFISPGKEKISLEDA